MGEKNIQKIKRSIDDISIDFLRGIQYAINNLNNSIAEEKRLNTIVKEANETNERINDYFDKLLDSII